MENVKVKRYQDPDSVRYVGWVEPDDGSWILFVPQKGEPELYTRRDPKTCAVNPKE
jgi:hypothetical protein